MKRSVALTCALCAALMLLPASASAEGGNSIAAGPVVTFGQLETGNTASGEPFGSYIVKSFWNLPVRAGDEITIDWEAKRGTRIIVFAPGTTDFTISSAHSVHKQGVGPTGRNEFRFSAATSGMMPLAFETAPIYAGPYAFTAYVKHWHPRKPHHHHHRH